MNSEIWLIEQIELAQIEQIELAQVSQDRYPDLRREHLIDLISSFRLSDWESTKQHRDTWLLRKLILLLSSRLKKHWFTYQHNHLYLWLRHKKGTLGIGSLLKQVRFPSRIRCFSGRWLTLYCFLSYSLNQFRKSRFGFGNRFWSVWLYFFCFTVYSSQA